MFERMIITLSILAMYIITLVIDPMLAVILAIAANSTIIVYGIFLYDKE